MHKIVKAEYSGGYRLWIRFDDGREGIVDLENELWGPVFEPLQDIERFRRFKISPVSHTIIWEPNADLAPEYLYQQLEPAGK